MRKKVLLLIITMSLTLTSGFGALPDAQQRLERLLANIGATEVRAEIISRTVETKVNTANGQNYKSMGPIVTFVDKLGTHALRKVEYPNQTIIIESVKLTDIKDVIATYLSTRNISRKSGGDTNLTISCKVPKVYGTAKALGINVLHQLGGQRVVQQSEEANLYFSAAASITGWGQDISVSNDSFNVDILLRPDESDDAMELYIMAPVMLGELGN